MPPKPSPIPTYKDYVQDLCTRNASLSTLHTFLYNPKPRQSHCRITALEFRDGSSKPITRVISCINMLHQELGEIHNDMYQEHNCKPLVGRILVIEDLAVDAVELLGSSLDIDPLFFSMHVHTARRTGMYHQTTDAATLPSRLRSHDYINISYHRPVTAEKEDPFSGRLMRDIAIDRKLVFLRSTNIGLVQHRASVIKIQRPDKIWIALILVDPPLKGTYVSEENKDDPVSLKLQPYLGLYEDFMALPNFSDGWRAASSRTQDSIMDDVIDCWNRRNPECFDTTNPTIQSLAFYPLKIVAAEWVKYIAVMQHCIKMYEYHGHQLPSLEKISVDMRELQGWRRRSMMSQQKIKIIIRKLQSHSSPNTQHCTAINDLLEDYRVIGSDIESAGLRLENMLPVLASLVQIIEARQSFAETANISRLTILALLFVPLSYVSSLFSMNSEHMPGSSRFWVYLAVAVPVTIIVFVIARPPTRALQPFAGWIGDRRKRRNVLKSRRKSKDVAA